MVNRPCVNGFAVFMLTLQYKNAKQRESELIRTLKRLRRLQECTLKT